MRQISRRQLLKGAAGVGAAVLGEVAANLENAERWVRVALREGAQWIVLPEFFTTAIALHPTKLVHAYRTLDGTPMRRGGSRDTSMSSSPPRAGHSPVAIDSVADVDMHEPASLRFFLKGLVALVILFLVTMATA